MMEHGGINVKTFCQIDKNLQRFHKYANHYTIALKFKTPVMYRGTPLKKSTTTEIIVISFLKHQTLLRHTHDFLIPIILLHCNQAFHSRSTQKTCTEANEMCTITRHTDRIKDPVQ